MKIVIVNQHTCNRGDEAAGRAVIESLLNAFPDANIDVLYRPDDAPIIINDSERVHNFPNISYKARKTGLLIFYLQIFLNFILLFLGFKKGFIGTSGNIYNKLSEADIVINAPTGPNIGDIYKDILYILTLIAATLLGKKTFMYGSSVGPFNTPWVRYLAKFLFDKMSIICVREDVSLGYLKELGLKNKNIYSSLDAAVQREICANDADKYYSDAGFKLNTNNVGITPLAYPWYPVKYRDKETQEIVEQNLIKIINKITEKGDTNVFFFPQLFSNHKDDNINKNDIPIINSIIGRVKHPEYCKILPQEYDSDIQQAMISKLDYFIGMRYHSLIFSVKMGIPVVGICYEHKAVGFLEKANLKELIVMFEDFYSSSNFVIDKIDYISENRETIISTINKSLPDLKSLSSKGTKLIKSFLGR